LPVRKAIVEAEIGLHARPAAQFVRAVTDTGLPITIGKEGIAPVDARSLLEVMTADFACGCEVELAVAQDAIPEHISLHDAEAALDALCALLGAGRTVSAAGNAA
jgi:phosphocarrier protein HPr